MSSTGFPKLPVELRQKICKYALSQPRVHEIESIYGAQVHFLPANSTPLLAVNLESRNLALQSSTIIQFPRIRFYFCPESDILLIDELETLYQCDGVFAHYIPSTGWEDLCDSMTVMALDPSHSPFTHLGPLTRPENEIDSWLDFPHDFAALLVDELKRFPDMEEVILLSPDEESTGMLVHVEQHMKEFALWKWTRSTRKGKGKTTEETVDEEEDENKEVSMEKALLDGWEYRVPKITILAYECNEEESAMSAMKRALLAYKA
ncbi:hypothetical protein BGZ57DRAFT_977742 [Hyaloscypha finlandica]|nr:hypothetical protein BGZ57DRAFT_977742 [Hyaloscypha finlandica]